MEDLEAKIRAAQQDPKNVGEMADADAVGTVGSPDCGDMLRMWVKFKDQDGKKVIDRATFQTFGCQTAIAVASVATELIAGKTVDEALSLSGEELAAPLGALPPMKIHCAQLVEGALRSALVPTAATIPVSGTNPPAATSAPASTLYDSLTGQGAAGRKVKVVLMDKSAAQSQVLTPPANFPTFPMHENSEITLSRDVEAIQIPSGNVITLPAGMTVVITQSLGGSYTVASPTGLSRITEDNADALGLTADGKPQEIPFTTDDLDPARQEKAAWDKLKTCFDPEIPVNIVDLGLVYGCEVLPNETAGKGSKIHVQMTLTAPGCGMGPSIAADAESKLRMIPGVAEAEVALVWDPPWNQHMITETGKMKLGIL